MRYSVQIKKIKFLKSFRKEHSKIPKSENKSWVLYLYKWLMNTCGIVIQGYLAWRLWHGKEEFSRFRERLGRPGQSRPPGSLLWLHAASVGETLSILPLIENLLKIRFNLSILLTTCSVSSAILAKKRLPIRAYHQYIPVDRPVFLRRFLDHWRPTLVLWTESEFWPNAILAVQERAIPLVLINGRISERSFQRWQKWPQGIIKAMLTAFDLCLGQTEQDCKRLSVLGARQTEYIGNLKFVSPPLPADREALAKIRVPLVGRPVWLAASTHAGEEAIVGRIHQRLVLSYPKLLTLIAPRHPSRGVAIATELTAAGLKVARRSMNEIIPVVSGIYIVDTIGELGLLFRVCSIVFIGKSLCIGGGQNPLEPARLGCAVLFGPHMTNFSDIATRMVTAGAARIVKDEAHLCAEIAALFEGITVRTAMGRTGQRLATTEAGDIMVRLLKRLGPYLDPGFVPETVH